MHLDLHLLPDKQISVRCCIDVCQPTFSFVLLDSLKITSFRNNSTLLTTVKSEPCRLPFRPQMIKYTLSHLQSGQLSFDYAGSLRGFFFIAEKRVVIEIDGSQHGMEEQKAADKKRDADLNALGITVLRYRNQDINQNFYAVCQDILLKLNLEYNPK